MTSEKAVMSTVLIKEGTRETFSELYSPLKQARFEVGDAHNQDIADQKDQDGGGQRSGNPHKPPHDKGKGARAAAVFRRDRRDHPRAGMGQAACGNVGSDSIRHSSRLLSPG